MSNILRSKFSDESAGPWIAFIRIFVGAFWLYEVLLGGRWKLGTLSSGVNPEWVGFAAGGDMIRLGERAIDLGTWEWYVILAETVIFPYAGLWSNIGTVVQVVLALGLIFGFGVRPLIFVVIVQELLILPLGTVRISPLMVIGSIFVFGANAGHYYGLDGYIKQKGLSGPIGAVLNPIAEMPLPPRSTWPVISGGMGVLALYHVLTIGTMIDRIVLAAMEFAALFAVSAIGIALVYKGGDALRVSADVVRLFIGYRVLHEIFIRTDPGINGLPGWAPAAELTPLFQEVAADQIAPVEWFIQTAMIPYMGVWAAIFAVATTTLAVGLLMGWHVRAVSAMGLVYTGFLMSLGFTRYAPFVFGYLFITMALAGKYMSVDATVGRETQPMTIGYYVVPIVAAVAILSAITALSFGNVPGEYMGDLPGTTATMLFIFATLITWVGFTQHGGIDRLALDRGRDEQRTA